MISRDDFVTRFCRAYGAKLQQFLVRRLRQPELAEEVAQETWMLLHQKQRLEEKHSPQRLLFDVAKKLARKKLRRVRLETTSFDTDTTDMEQMIDVAPR